jgi:hypothetical protein
LQVTTFNNAYACISALRSLKSDLAFEGGGGGGKKRKEKKSSEYRLATGYHKNKKKMDAKLYKNLVTKGAKLSIFKKSREKFYTLQGTL